MFFIYSSFVKSEVSVLFSSKALIENVIKQSQQQPSFIHLDGTYKLIDLGLPLLIVSTENIENIMQNFRPIAFFVSWSESSSQVTLMMKKLQDFLSENFNFELKPQYILTDNSDALITGCKKAFGHDYIRGLSFYGFLGRSTGFPRGSNFPLFFFLRINCSFIIRLIRNLYFIFHNFNCDVNG